MTKTRSSPAWPETPSMTDLKNALEELYSWTVAGALSWSDAQPGRCVLTNVVVVSATLILYRFPSGEVTKTTSCPFESVAGVGVLKLEDTFGVRAHFMLPAGPSASATFRTA